MLKRIFFNLFVYTCKRWTVWN